MWWVYFVLTLWVGWILIQFRNVEEACFSDGELLDFVMYVLVFGILMGGTIAFILISPYLTAQGLL